MLKAMRLAGLMPRSSSRRFCSVRMNRPALINSRIEIVTCATTSAFRRRTPPPATAPT